MQKQYLFDYAQPYLLGSESSIQSPGQCCEGSVIFREATGSHFPSPHSGTASAASSGPTTSLSNVRTSSVRFCLAAALTSLEGQAPPPLVAGITTGCIVIGRVRFRLLSPSSSEWSAVVLEMTRALRISRLTSILLAVLLSFPAVVL